MRFSRGDPIEIEHQGRMVDGTILMISENQMSALFGFNDAMIDGHVQMMPAFLYHADGDRRVYRSIINGAEVVVRRKA